MDQSLAAVYIHYFERTARNFYFLINIDCSILYSDAAKESIFNFLIFKKLFFFIYLKLYFNYIKF